MSPYNSTFSKPSKPLAKKSAKRVIEDREWADVRAFVMQRDGYACKGWARLVALDRSHYLCAGPLDPHHIVTVARDKTLRLEPTNLITLCRRHHDWVHDHPAEATELGLLRSAGAPCPEAPR